LTSISEKCPYLKCDGEGLIHLKNWSTGEEKMQECKCRQDKSHFKKLTIANIPEEFRGVTIASFDVSLYKDPESKQRAATAKRAAANFVKNFEAMRTQGKGLYLYSYEKGSGKSRLAASILNALCKVYDSDKKPLRVLYSSAVNLLDEIRKTFGKDSKVSTSELIERIKNADVLVIDDLGVENVTDWVEQIFTTILEHRLTNKKVTIFTSNLSVDELDEKYKAGRVSSRIEKMAFPIYMPDERVRSHLAKKENEMLQDILFS
jgi:DNA replication protein DnaC